MLAAVAGTVGQVRGDLKLAVALALALAAHAAYSLFE